MKRRTEKKQANRYFEDRAKERRRERGHHLRWHVHAIMREAMNIVRCELTKVIDRGVTDPNVIEDVIHTALHDATEDVIRTALNR